MKAQDILDIAFDRMGRWGERTGYVQEGYALSQLNWVQKDFLTRTRLYYGTFNTVCKTGVRTYQLPTYMFEPVEVHMKQWVTTNKKWVVMGRGAQKESSFMSDNLSSFMNSAGSAKPYVWCLAEGINQIGIMGMTNNASYVGTMTVFGYRTATDLTAGGTPVFLPQFHGALAEGLIPRLAPPDSVVAKSAQERYERYVQEASNLKGVPDSQAERTRK